MKVGNYTKLGIDIKRTVNIPLLEEILIVNMKAE